MPLVPVTLSFNCFIFCCEHPSIRFLYSLLPLRRDWTYYSIFIFMFQTSDSDIKSISQNMYNVPLPGAVRERFHSIFGQAVASTGQ